VNALDRLDAAFTQRSVELPADYDSDETRERVAAGLERRGYPRGCAVRAARDALREAPFVPPDDDGWRYVCTRARQIAAELCSADEDEL
jgi:hypothetical protein